MSWVGRSAFYVASSANLCGRACQALINRTFNRALLVPIAAAVTLAGFASPAFAQSPPYQGTPVGAGSTQGMAVVD
jgi:hypothetical protein